MSRATDVVVLSHKQTAIVHLYVILEDALHHYLTLIQLI